MKRHRGEKERRKQLEECDATTFAPRAQVCVHYTGHACKIMIQ